MTTLKSSDPSEHVLSFLKERRSSLAKFMTEPGPDEAQISEIIALSARVPDHRKLAPWRFVTFTGQARRDFGKTLGARFEALNPDLPLDRVIFEAQRFMRAPCVIAVISAPVECPRGTPKWEQELSAGALCFQMLLAASAMGFAGQWLTEWYAYDAEIGKALRLNEGERVAGFIYIGTASEPPTERARPDAKALIQKWSPS